MMNQETFTIKNKTPTVETYRKLRRLSGLSPKTEEAAKAGLRGTLFAVQAFHRSEAVGMARLIGDGGCHFQVVDVAVLPEHQRKGLGQRMMAELKTYIDTHLPESAYISLIADGHANKLYEKFGFRPVAPASIGMYLRVDS
ncbi:MAG: GNAT family N-acetyltransferase [Balneolaceae bacterium]